MTPEGEGICQKSGVEGPPCLQLIAYSLYAKVKAKLDKDER